MAKKLKKPAASKAKKKSVGKTTVHWLHVEEEIIIAGGGLVVIIMVALFLI